MTKIVSRWDSNKVLYEAPEGQTMREALEAAAAAGVNLRGASLYVANLYGANLYGADLRGASLYGANLYGANLYGADLRGASLYVANLYGANLYGADLTGADLYGADLRGASLRGANGETLTLVGGRPFMQIGPIGSRGEYVSVWLTDSGPMVRAGCFWNTLAEFEATVAKTHGDSLHGDEYMMAVMLMEAHARLWTPEEQSNEG